VPDAAGELVVDRPLDLGRTLAPHRVGGADPSWHGRAPDLWWARRTPDGPGTVRFDARDPDRVAVTAWGPGAAWLVANAPRVLGRHDTGYRSPGVEGDPVTAFVEEVGRRHPGVRLGAGDRIVEVLVPTILAQKVTATEAVHGHRRLVARYGEDAPGPVRLRLPPDPSRLATLPYPAFHPLGVERRRAEAIRGVCARAPRLESLTGGPPGEAARVLTCLPGIGPWTASIVRRLTFGDPDSVIVGDYNLPALVAWTLTGERRADDARMLELLEPFRGQRGRVQRLLTLAGARPPRRAPRARLRNLARL
jgi:3-methyladenine DNA glycosylase/8-oxoguanine DNA glycosylase